MGLRPLPAVLQADGDLSGRRRSSGAAARGRSSSSAGRPRNPLFQAFFEAVQQAGYELTSDVNGYRQEGFAAFDRTIYRGRRLSAARAYLHPAMSRRNLDVRCRALVHGVLFDGTRATGVEVARARRHSAAAIGAGEVILCGGAINSPQLLQLSGVGNAGELERARRSSRSPTCRASARTSRTTSRSTSSTHRKQPVSVAPALKYRNRPKVGLQWLLLRTGPGATNHFEAGGFVRGDDEVAYPNLMFHFLPLAIRYDGICSAGARLPGPRRADVLGRTRVGEDRLDRSSPAPGAALQLPLDRAGSP